MSVDAPEPKFSSHLDEGAVTALAEVIMPRKRKWWHFPKWSDDDRLRLRFGLRTFLLRARDR